MYTIYSNVFIYLVVVFLVFLFYFFFSFFFFFFFSSRRRHTRCLSDWSSDVCSSDLQPRRQRDRQHTMDRQAEQLLMAGIYPVSLAPWLPAAGSLPVELAGKRFVVLIPGSSPRHLAKR